MDGAIKAEPRRDEIAEIMAKSEIRVAKIGQRTTLVYVTLPCGFEVCETVSTAATGTTSDEDVTNIALRAAEKKVFELEQYRVHLEAHANACKTELKEG